MKQKNVILMVVAVGCGLVAAFLTTQINARPKVEQVEVLVAAKDLPIGTILTKTDLAKFVTKKKVAKEMLPPSFVNEEADLFDKRLLAPVPAEGFFVTTQLTKGSGIILPEGKDMVSLGISTKDAGAGFVGPGSHVDVLATMSIGKKYSAFPLLVDMLVLAVDTHTTLDKSGAFPSMNTVSLAVTQEQALVLSLAKKRGCTLELLLRHNNKPLDPKYNLEMIKKLLQEDNAGQGVVPTETRPGEVKPEVEPTSSPPKPKDLVEPVVEANPAPQAPKVVMVKVLKAAADIPANTEITKDLIAQSFTEKEMSKEVADLLQAYEDLTPLLGQIFKQPIYKDQLVIKGMIGQQVAKVAPPEVFDPSTKAGPPPEAPKAEPKPVRKTHDMVAHAASGTKIYRYEEVKPGEWKFLKVLTPEEAAKERNGTETTESPKPVETPSPEKPSETKERKID